MALLDPVRELLPDADHWCQGRSFRELPNGTTQRCLMEALWVAFNPAGFTAAGTAYNAGRELAREKGYRGGVEFNDKPERTFDDIQQFIDELEARLQ